MAVSERVRQNGRSQATSRRFAVENASTHFEVGSKVPYLRLPSHLGVVRPANIHHDWSHHPRLEPTSTSTSTQTETTATTIRPLSPSAKALHAVARALMDVVAHASIDVVAICEWMDAVMLCSDGCCIVVLEWADSVRLCSDGCCIVVLEWADSVRLCDGWLLYRMLLDGC
jgi:hypothetical protein